MYKESDSLLTPYFWRETDLVYYDLNSPLWIARHGETIFDQRNIFETVIVLMEVSAQTNRELAQYFFDQMMIWIVIHYYVKTGHDFLYTKIIPRLQSIVKGPLGNQGLVQTDLSDTSYLSKDMLQVYLDLNAAVHGSQSR